MCKTIKELATVAAEKTRIFRAVVEGAVCDRLPEEIKKEGFSDIYAQTVVYGLLMKRACGEDLENFCLADAVDFVPPSNKNLRHLFGRIADWCGNESIGDIADWCRRTNVKEILGDYAFDFYEIFLSEYDKSLRSKCGVWYTPQPVVSFIVKAIDEILQKDFNMPRGLADASTVKITTETSEEKEVPRLQILDPAVGTGTFLAEVIKQTYAKF